MLQVKKLPVGSVRNRSCGGLRSGRIDKSVKRHESQQVAGAGHSAGNTPRQDHTEIYRAAILLAAVGEPYFAAAFQ